MAARDAGLAGFEFAAGIPGSLGGAIMMNAGAYGGEMKQVVRTVDVLYPGKGIKTYSGEEMEFGYRTSRLKREDGIVLAAAIELGPGDKQAITDRITELAQQRKDKQPLEFASAGSTFKRPEGYFAGKLIQDAGLKGFRVGDAQVSEKHAGFVINRGNASAAQIRKLIEEVQRIVLEDAGVQLEREVIFLGEF
jgi:UDP-N-acetylmuramate dehydrogenase